MTQDQPKKLFSVEKRALAQHGDIGATSAIAYDFPTETAPSSVDTDAIMEELRSMRSEIAELRGVASDPQDEDTDHELMQGLQVEVAQMVRMIGRAKSEIAALKHPMAEEDHVERASMQLETIVKTTEEATNEIMGATDEIDATMKKIHALTVDDPDVAPLIDETANHVIKIIEACSFQDLTGQRVTQVIKTLRFIAARILAMVDIWGLPAFQDLPIPAVDGPAIANEDEEAGLLEGPAMEGQGLSQDDIDALFD
ncbi:MAG: hypothetical protein HOL85_11030 [Rhodospirillaceae bacterium]|nr:hypothetical protein [Rhodospirillaceae bacterium]MBT6136107.1 hypothetical protein [Rhodospirillaceae bacterium]